MIIYLHESNRLTSVSYTHLFHPWSYSPTQMNESSLSNKVVSSVCDDGQGKLWIGTAGGGINVFENGKRVAIYTKENRELLSNSVLCSLKDSEGNLWFGTYLGNISYYNTRLKKFQIIELEKNQLLDVRVFYEDKNKKIWIGTHAGVFVVDLASKKVIHHYDTSNSQLLENFVRSIAQDSEGRFWKMCIRDRCNGERACRASRYPAGG